MAKVSVYMVFLLIQLCSLWCTSSLVAGQQSSNNAVARVTSARNKVKNEYMEVVEDKTADSGWAINIKKKPYGNWADNYIYVYMWAIEKDKPAYRHAFFVKDDGKSLYVCQFISNKTSHKKYALDNFMPSQIMKMIFPGNEDSCDIKNGTRAIQSEAHVNADRRDRSNRKVGIPYTFPFDLIVNVVNFINSDPLEDYIFQVNFTVDSKDNGSTGKKKNGNDNGKPRRECLDLVTIPYECHDPKWWYYIIWRACPAYAPPYMVTESDGPINVPARIIDVNATEDNIYFAAVKDNSSEIGWGVKVESAYARAFWEDWFTFEIFYIDPTDKSVHHIFSAYLCDVLAFDSSLDGFPEKDFLPRQLVDVIFPGHQGSCDLKDESVTPMKSNTTVNLNPYQNPRVNLPKATHFNLLAAIRPESWRNESYEINYFLVNFTIGNPESTDTGSKYICLGRHWNYFTVWSVCKIAEFFESGVFGVGRLILHLC